MILLCKQLKVINLLVKVDWKRRQCNISKAKELLTCIAENTQKHIQGKYLTIINVGST